MSVLMAVVCVCGVCSTELPLTSNHIDYCRKEKREGGREGKEERRRERGERERKDEEGEGNRGERERERQRETERQRQRERERERERQHNNLMYSFKNSPT